MDGGVNRSQSAAVLADNSGRMPIHKEPPMNTRSSYSRTQHMIASVLVLMGASAVFAADPPAANSTAASKEMREKMATVHEHMAACLRSDKPLADCRSEMMKDCQDTMGKKECPMMGHGMMGTGSTKRAHMMQDGAKKTEDHK
jgi:hypothetical protein